MKRVNQRPTRTSMFVLCAFVLFTFSTSAQTVRDDDPVRVVEEDECGTPTEDQCQDPAWLYSRDPCAQRQNAPGSICASLLTGAFESQDESELYIVAKNLEPNGIGHVVRTSAQQIAPQRTYMPDLFSVTSKKAGADYGAVDAIGIDLHAAWNANGGVVESCREYAYERFYDINAYQTRIGHFRDDYGRAFEDAYASASNPWAIGSRHLHSDNLRGKDGRVFGRLLNHDDVAKNEFFRMREHPLLPGAMVAPVAAGLLTSLSAFDNVTADRLQKIASHKVNGAHYVEKTWAWQWQMRELLSFQPGDPPAFQPNKLMAPQNDNAIELNLPLVMQNGPQRKRLYAELNELEDLQRRLLKLQQHWAKLDLKYAGSGWTVEGAGLGEDDLDFGLLNAVILGPQKDGPAFALPLADPDVQLAPPVLENVELALDLQAPDLETASRLAVLNELVEVLAIADNEGCLDMGATGCDWSPKAFVSSTLDKFAASEDERFAWCEDFSGGNLQNLKNLDIVFVEHEQFYCDVVTGDDLTATQVEALEDRVEECRQKKIAYQNFVELEEAKNRVRAIPELVDPSTGAFQFPGIDKSRDEYMGNKYFGLGYDYGFGFGMDVQSEICSIDMHAGGHFNTYTKVFGQQVMLLDTVARVDTEERRVQVHAKILGVELFTGVDETWATQEDLHFNFVKTPSKEKKQKIIDTTIVVVVVPIGIELGISGEVGAKLGLTIDTEGLGGDACPKVTVGGLVEPYLGVSGYISAAIDIFIAAAGIRGEVNIITVSLPFKPGIGLAVIGDADGDLLPDDLELDISASLDLKLQTLSGLISAYAEIGFCPLCYTGEFTIIKWQGPSWNQNLFDQSYTIGLSDLGAAFND